MLKQRLLSFDVFYDNNYLDLYVQLIEDNMLRECETGKTQSHHIVPVSYYKHRDIPVDNNSENRVHLLQKDHVLAHYYLFFAFSDRRLKYDSACAVQHTLGHSNFPDDEFVFLEQLEDYQLFYEESRKLYSENNCMFDPIIRQQHDEKMRTDEVRSAISSTMKRIRQETSNYVLIHKEREGKRVPPDQVSIYLDQGWKLGSKRSNFVMMHRDNVEIAVYIDDIDSYIADGWTRGGRPGRVSSDHRRALEESHYKHVTCYDVDDIEVQSFTSVTAAAKWWYENGYGRYGRKVPKDYHGLLDVIKLSSTTGKYIEGLKWVYGERR